MININPQVEAAIAQFAEEAHDAILDAIQSKHWYWPNETRRKNKQVVGSPRDIVDLGELLKSQKKEVDGTNIRFYNEAPYSDLVHEGGSNGHAILPARPFMTDTLEELSVTERIAELLKANLTGDKRDVIRLRDDRGRFISDKGLRDINIDTETTKFDGSTNSDLGDD